MRMRWLSLLMKLRLGRRGYERIGDVEERDVCVVREVLEDRCGFVWLCAVPPGWRRESGSA